MSDLEPLLAELRGDDESSAETAALLLANAGEAAFPGLLTLLESSEADHRWWAVRTLAAMREPRVEWLLHALEDPDVDVRAAAALAFIAHPDSSAVSALITMLSDEDGVAASVATSALIALGQTVVPNLLDAFDGSTARARIQILRALAALRDPRAIGLLMKVMDEGSSAMQYWARQGLDQLGLDMVYMTPD